VSPGRSTFGLTLIEVLLALAVIGIVTAAFTTAVVSNLHHTSVTGARTEAVQVLNYLGRRAAGGDGAVLPASGSSRTWAYGSLAGSFPDLTDPGGLSDPGRYRAQITNAGDVSLAGSRTAEYDVRVCYEAAGGEHCVSATTMGLYPSSGGSTPQLPGIY
jgi:prepilin-type N-terminal cleavage/methylation domain-containing protein